MRDLRFFVSSDFICVDLQTMKYSSRWAILIIGDKIWLSTKWEKLSTTKIANDEDQQL